MIIRIWDRSDTLKCSSILVRVDWVKISMFGTLILRYYFLSSTIFMLGILNSLARSYTGKLSFTGGKDCYIHKFEITEMWVVVFGKTGKWIPCTAPVYYLAFKFPWLVSASSDGKTSLIDVRKFLKVSRQGFFN